MIATGEVIANPSDNYKFMIILSPAKSYSGSKSIDRRAF
jgi:branched-chain amino acid aminotransferase